MSMMVSNRPRGPMPPGMRDERAPRGRLLGRRLVHAFAAALVGFVLTWALKSWLTRPTPAPVKPFDAQANAELIKPVWTRLDKPVAIFGLEGPEFDRLPRRYEARQREAGGGREDTLGFGAFAGDQPYFSVTFYRPGEEAVRGGNLFIETVRRTAEEGLAVTKFSMPEPVPTKLGPLEVAEGTLAGADGERSCLIFRHVASETSLRLHGVACGSSAHPLDRVGLACTINRIGLLQPGDDKALRAFFAKAETRRNEGCAAPVAAAGGRR